jgi:uncharacterized protein
MRFPRPIGMAVVSLAVMAVLDGCGTTNSSNATTSTSQVPATTTTSDLDGSEVDRLPTVPGPSATPPSPNLSTAAGQAAFLKQVFADIQAVWKADFSQGGVTYSPARLVMFKTSVSTACGNESADVGPFYCPGDRTVYLDTSFFAAMATQFGVKGDFAEAYVVAHEMGHHVQNLLGINSRVAQLQAADPSAKNKLSISLELQADCFAGIWAHSTYTRNLLEPGDIDEALTAAQAVGDDYLAHAAGATVDPDSWTHGTSAQRQQWFTTGFEDGQAQTCDTFTDLRF